jgi:hypothetical protein
LATARDRTFVGQSVEGVDRPVTAAVEVPEEAVDLSFQNGTLGDRFLRVGNRVYDTLPVPPGESLQQIVVQYCFAATDRPWSWRQELLYPGGFAFPAGRQLPWLAGRCARK